MNPVETHSLQTLSPDQQAEIDRIFASQKANQTRIAKLPMGDRIAKLHRLRQAILDHKGEIREAMYRDFRKNPSEVDLTEIYPVVSEIKHTIKGVSGWVAPRRVSAPWSLIGTRSYCYHDPKGVVLIISPWNYPINLSLGPLSAAVAAGNCIILKPSEYTPHTNACIKKMLAGIFEENEVAVIEGDHLVGEALTKKTFDHVFFTGSAKVAQRVVINAGSNMASFTLELGGKTPVVVDKGANLDDAAKKIVWGKFLNMGQSCIAPDYLFVHKDDRDRMVELMIGYIKKYYGETESDRIKSPDYARVISDSHFERLENLMNDAVGKGAVVAFGGQTDASDRYISPTLLTQVDLSSEIMQEEIFGPLLPVLTYENLDETIQLIKSKPEPLAMYIFSHNSEHVNHLMHNTLAGGLCVNNVLLHFFQLNLPFGGVNKSGMGKSHGYYGFEAFATVYGVLHQTSPRSMVDWLYPPYTPKVQKLIDRAIKWL
jgi:aldehyde dehydrogenase (NAD+)